MSLPPPNSPPDLEALLAHSSWVRKLAQAMASGKEFADDTEQEAWRIAMERPPTHGSNLKAWWKSVVRSAAYQRGRSEGRHQRRVDRVAQTRPSRGVEEPYQVAERLETIQNLARLVQELEEPYGSTIYAHYFEGVPVAALAKQLDVSKSTIQSRLQRGVARLRTRMKGVHGEGWRSHCLALAFPVTSVPAALSFLPLALMNTQLKVALSVAALATIGAFTVWNPFSADPLPVELEAQLADSTPPVDSEPIPTEPIKLGLRTLVTDGLQEPKSSRFDLPEGKKRDAWLEFKMLDAQGKPTPRLPINLWGTPNYAISAQSFRANEKGVLRIPCISGEWELSARSSVRYEGNGFYLSQDVDLLPGETFHFSYQHPGWQSVFGRVTNAADQPIRDAELEIHSDISKRNLRINLEDRTNADGAFSFDGGRGGAHTISVTPVGYPALRAILQKINDQTEIEFNLQYPEKREITLLVMDRKGAPLADAIIRYEDWPHIWLRQSEHYSMHYDRQHLGITDQSGRIRVPAQKDTPWPVSVHHPMYGDFTIEIPAEVSQFSYRIPTGNTLHGRVLGPDGEPIAGAKVRGWGPVESKIKPGDLPGQSFALPDRPWKQAITDQEGKFELTRLQASSLGVILVEAPGMAYLTKKEVVFPGPAEGLTVLMQKESVLAGRLLDHDGLPIPDRHMVIKGQPQFGWMGNELSSFEQEKNNSWMANSEQLRTDSNGHFSFPGLNQGLWTIEVDGLNSSKLAAKVRVEAGTNDLIIHPGDGFEDKVNVSGKVMDASTQLPVPKFGVVLVSEDGKGIGRSFQNISPGSSRVHFNLNGNPVQEYVLQIDSPGYAQWRNKIPALMGKNYFSVELLPVFPITLQVLSSDGVRIEGIPIQVFTTNREAVISGGNRFYSLEMLDQNVSPYGLLLFRSSSPKDGLLSIEGIPYQGGYFLVGGNLGLPDSGTAIERPSLEIPFHYQPSENSEPRVITLPDDFLTKWLACADQK
jgi:RNA polymerase sigma factor (sigma-70 family)